MRAKYRILLILAVAVLLFLLWGFRQLVPAGLRLGSVEPFYLWSRDLGTFDSPEGTNEVRVIVNDGGAMHSGHHWAWVIHTSRLYGQRVIAEGYIAFEDTNRERFPLRWLSEREIEVTFCKARRSGDRVAGAFPVPP